MHAKHDSAGPTGAHTLQPGDLVAKRYQVVREIGHGGYAVVYKARDLRTDELVALKTLHPVAPRPEEVRARFRREVDLVSRLRHPNTVRVFDYGFDEELYLVMELLEGQPLSNILDGVHGLDLRRSVVIARGVLDSLTEAHSFGIVHRDLKPENVFLAVDSEGNEVVKVLDFGIAKLTGFSDEELEQQELTLQGRAMGTPTYMSPEQARGAKLTTSSDIYSVSVLLYEMICGVPPFQGDAAMDIMLKHVNEPPPQLTIPRLHGSLLERAILKGLAKEPEHRFRSAYDFLAAVGGAGQHVSDSLFSSADYATDPHDTLPAASFEGMMLEERILTREDGVPDLAHARTKSSEALAIQDAKDADLEVTAPQRATTTPTLQESARQGGGRGVQATPILHQPAAPLAVRNTPSTLIVGLVGAIIALLVVLAVLMLYGR